MELLPSSLHPVEMMAEIIYFTVPFTVIYFAVLYVIGFLYSICPPLCPVEREARSPANSSFSVKTRSFSTLRAFFRTVFRTNLTPVMNFITALPTLLQSRIESIKLSRSCNAMFSHLEKSMFISVASHSEADTGYDRERPSQPVLRPSDFLIWSSKSGGSKSSEKQVTTNSADVSSASSESFIIALKESCNRKIWCSAADQSEHLVNHWIQSSSLNGRGRIEEMATDCRRMAVNLLNMCLFDVRLQWPHESHYVPPDSTEVLSEHDKMCLTKAQQFNDPVLFFSFAANKDFAPHLWNGPPKDSTTSSSSDTNEKGESDIPTPASAHSDQEVRNEVLAGYNNFAVQLHAFFVHLAIQSDTQALLQADMSKIFSDNPSAAKDWPSARLPALLASHASSFAQEVVQLYPKPHTSSPSGKPTSSSDPENPSTLSTFAPNPLSVFTYIAFLAITCNILRTYSIELDLFAAQPVVDSLDAAEQKSVRENVAKRARRILERGAHVNRGIGLQDALLFDDKLSGDGVGIPLRLVKRELPTVGNKS